MFIFRLPIEEVVQRKGNVAIITRIVALHQRLQDIVQCVVQYRWEQTHAEASRLLHDQQKHLIQFLHGFQSVRRHLYATMEFRFN